MTMWGGRFQNSASQLFKLFNDSLSVDCQMVLQDIEGSIAWAEALTSVSVLDHDELESIVQGLHDIKESVILQPDQILQSQAEDIHSWVEQQLVAKIGSAGKKLHTGRSRNDQVVTDFKLWCREKASLLDSLLAQLIETIECKALEEAESTMPSYTHLQRAQPITFGFWLQAISAMLKKDRQRLALSSEINNQCPLGSGAIAGTAFAIDRHQLAEKLGFQNPTENALETVSDRDFVVDFLYSIATNMLHLSRACEDLIFFNSDEVGFIKLDDSVTSGSSLMPQKKNPDALELIRGKAATAISDLNALMITLKGLSLGYNKDLQQDKSVLFAAVESWQQCLLMFQQVISCITTCKEKMLASAQQSFVNATELADYMVSLGVPFRLAHEQTGQLVVFAEHKGKYLQELSLEDFHQVNADITEEVYQWLDVKHALTRREAFGGTAPARVRNASRSGDIEIGCAQAADAEEVIKLVDYWAKTGDNLPRTKNNVLTNLMSFKVAKNKQAKVVGCGSLHIYDDSLVEIRSLGVAPQSQGAGVGAALVLELMKQAAALGLTKVFVLTRKQTFFSHLGFELTSLDSLPEKVLKDCQYCLRKEACDEVAMIYHLVNH
ncbi:argininosuccinate lyase [Pleionea sp. CnH1-48]|uniref:argininosuccinate lyase n=1 Tax=Pleionea sp. CnH1-48 TaxID=2954494 RepID=UPI002096EC05|nr:argininosuccinate lyase [Pleionea sp. CnH1-48]MCO7224449.1 argininosuccinate lyase [Pleionea sp. CnH1-48]